MWLAGFPTTPAQPKTVKFAKTANL